MVNYITITPFLTRLHEEIHLAEISRLSKTPYPTARLHLNEFEKQGFLRKRKRGRQTLYSLNLNNPNIVDLLIIAEKMVFIRRCEEEPVLAELARELRGARFAVLFGSAVHSVKRSKDIDLLLPDERAAKRVRTSAYFGDELEIIPVALEKVTATLRKEITKQHLILAGSEAIIAWMIGSNGALGARD